MKDWIGNSRTAFAIIGASNHSECDREANDYYATEPKATELLLEAEKFSHHVWECACGEKHMSNVIEAHGYDVRSSDIFNRGGYSDVEIIDFLNATKDDIDRPRDIITNPPYSHAQEFVEKAMELVEEGGKVAMFLKLTFLEGKKRKELFKKYPPKVLYVSSSRLQCAKNGDFEKNGKGVGTAIAYGWFIWEKGYKGEPVIRWIN